MLNQDVSSLLGDLDIPRAATAPPPQLHHRWDNQVFVRSLLHMTDVMNICHM